MANIGCASTIKTKSSIFVLYCLRLSLYLLLRGEYRMRFFHLSPICRFAANIGCGNENINFNFLKLNIKLTFRYFLLSVWTERRNKKEPRTRSAVEQMGFPVSGCGTRGFAAQTVLARDDTEKPHLLPTAPAIVRPANTPPLVVADLLSGFDNDLFFFSDRFELATFE